MRGVGYNGCFPTGRHYPGIADRIAAMIQNVVGLAEEFDAAANWAELPIAVIDFETTGVNPEVDRVIEIGICLFDGGELGIREGLLVNPGIPIDEESRAIHGITDEELEGAPDFETTLPRVIELLQGRLPVAYNHQFDRAFLYAEIGRVKTQLTDGTLPPALRPETVWIDPLVWARETFKEEKSRKLTAVAERLGVPLEQAHRAAGDAEATGRVLFALAQHMPHAYGEIVRLQGRYAAFQDAEMTWKRFK